jgi:hypothetical protein
MPTNKAYEIQVHTLFNSWQDQINDATPSSFWRAGWFSAVSQHNYDIMTQYDWYGDKVFQWVEENKSYDFINRDHIVNKVELYRGTYENFRTGDPIPTCFVPGTLISTGNGFTPIESLWEHESVLTRADPQQWGVRSSETIKLPAPEFVYGINEEGVFFTAGHAFFTTTGLRALDPETARRENPWLEVGTLAVGHILRHTIDGKTYEAVKIESIQKKKCQRDFVYGVHLREGLRSYHANGLLVALNYPEITVASVAKELLTFTPAERLRLLAGLKEVAPLLQRFGGRTVLDLLEEEAQLLPTQYGGKPRVSVEVLALDLYKSYGAHDRDSGASLAQIEVYSGVLMIDGQFCEHASFNKNIVDWSRKLSDGRWEHAWCQFFDSGIRASGRMFRSESLNPMKEDVVNGVQRFHLVPGTEKLQDAGLFPSDIAVSRQAYFHPEATRAEAGWVVGVAAGAEAAAAEDKREDDEDETNSAKVVAPERSEMSARRVTLEQQLSFLPTTTITTSTSEESAITLTYDEREFDLGTDEKSWTPSLALATTSCAIQDGGAEYSTLIIDQYINIRDAMVRSTKNELKDEKSHAFFDSMPQLFQVDQTTDWENRTVFDFESTHASKILQVSDQYQSCIQQHGHKEDVDWKQVPKRDLTFTNIGLDPSFKLPLLFSKLRLRLNALATQVTGVVTEYDPSLPEYSGTPHWVHGTLGSINVPQISAIMSIVPEPKPKSEAGFTERKAFAVHSAPHFLARQLAENTFADDDETVMTLMVIPYRQADINGAVQRLIANIMSFHLDDTTRETFMGSKNKPTIPLDYGDDLDPTTKTWLKDTYGPAYICMVLSHQETLVAQNKRFSEEQKKRIRYFWNGKGNSCLAQSKIFHALERSVTRYQIRNYYKAIGDVYKDSNAGLRLSDKIFASAIRPVNLGKFGREKTEDVGDCHVCRALHPC